LVGNKCICQAYLGAKIHDVKDPLENLGPMFRQVVYPLFQLMEENADKWKKIKGSEPIPTYGTPSDKEPKAFSVNLEGMIENYKEGFKNLSVFWERIINTKSFAVLKNLTRKRKIENFLISVEDWAKIIYDFASTFHQWKRDRGKLVEIMRPLYYARVASFINRTRDMTTKEAEEIIGLQARVFEEMKPYLLRKWEKK
jgi:hypothetical protein